MFEFHKHVIVAGHMTDDCMPAHLRIQAYRKSGGVDSGTVSRSARESRAETNNCR